MLVFLMLAPACAGEDSSLFLKDAFSVIVGSVESDVLVCTEAMGDMNVCYILDGILVLFGAVLTILYCRLRVRQTVSGVRRTQKGSLQHFTFILLLSSA